MMQGEPRNNKDYIPTAGREDDTALQCLSAELRNYIESALAPIPEDRVIIYGLISDREIKSSTLQQIILSAIKDKAAENDRS